MIDGPLEARQENEIFLYNQAKTVAGVVFCAVGYIAVLAFQVWNYGW